MVRLDIETKRNETKRSVKSINSLSNRETHQMVSSERFSSRLNASLNSPSQSIVLVSTGLRNHQSNMKDI